MPILVLLAIAALAAWGIFLTACLVAGTVERLP
jgi:hypothetical protein